MGKQMALYSPASSSALSTRQYVLCFVGKWRWRHRERRDYLTSFTVRKGYELFFLISYLSEASTEASRHLDMFYRYCHYY